jgi:small subunit ribosomal protein S17
MKVFTGKVLSTKMAKTAVVAVERRIPHALYKKHFTVTKKYHVHDELGVVVGQKVKFTGSKQYSKLKKWKILEIVDETAKTVKKERNAKKIVAK